jgi:hypothetical protein
MSAFLTHLFEPNGKIGELWCSLMHDAAMWPIHDHYECRHCGRRYPVPWGARQAAGGPHVPATPLSSVPSIP